MWFCEMANRKTNGTCGIENIEDCPRRQNEIPESMKRYGPYFEWEYNSSMPDEYKIRD